MHLNPYLTFNGQCEAAFRFYEQCLGGKIVMMLKHGEAPLAEQATPESRDTILHARLTWGDDVLMGSDAPSGRYQQPAGFYVSLMLGEAAEADRIFSILAEGGTVQMPLQETFWAVRFGMLVDRFGTPWMVNCEKPA